MFFEWIKIFLTKLHVSILIIDKSFGFIKPISDHLISWKKAKKLHDKRIWFPEYCHISRLYAFPNFLPLQKHLRKVVGGFGKKSCVSTGVRKPGNTFASPTAMI